MFAPLAMVVCQVHYDTNLAVADATTARALHDALGGRTGSYPRVQQIQSPAAGGGWRFVADDERWAVAALPDRVSLETTSYENWDHFRERLQAVLAAAAEQLEPAVEQRLGLRYINRLAQPWAKS